MSTYSQDDQKDEELFSLWCNKLDLAKNRFLAIELERREGYQEVYRKGIIIDKEVSLNKFSEFCDKEPRVAVNFRLIDGRIEAYEMVLDPHALVQGILINIMGSWNRQALNVMGNLNNVVNRRSSYHCDACVRPKNRQLTGRPVNSQGLAYPTLVAEVGNTESLRSLHDLAAEFFSVRTSIQIYLSIKIFPPHQDGTRALLAMLYVRTDPNNLNHVPTTPIVVKSFGTADLHISTQNYLLNTLNIPANTITGVGFGGVPCNSANIQTYQLDIPTNLLFDGVNTPPNTPAYFTIDLFDVLDSLAEV